jgi:hypothetical protein
LSVVANTRLGVIRRAARDGRPVFLLECPGCGQFGELDDDQWHGRVSVDHASQGCPGLYHETHDFHAAVQACGGFRVVQ